MTKTREYDRHYISTPKKTHTESWWTKPLSRAEFQVEAVRQTTPRLAETTDQQKTARKGNRA